MLGPEVADELGDRFRPLFDAYAFAHPRQAGSRAREDAVAFAEWCRDSGEVSAKRKTRWKFWLLELTGEQTPSKNPPFGPV